MLRRRTARLTESRSVREELRDREIRRLARRRLQICKLGQILRHGIAHVQPPLVLQHEHRGAGDRFRHRGDPEKCLRRHPPFRCDIRKARALDMQHLILRHDHRDRARDFIFRHHLPHRRAYAREQRLVGGCKLCEKKSGGGEDGGEMAEVHGEDQYSAMPHRTDATLFSKRSSRFLGGRCDGSYSLRGRPRARRSCYPRCG